MAAMLFIRHRFARCSRDLKRLESTSRSPVYSHLTSTIHGLKVIRSYHAEKICLDEFCAHLDDHTRVSYLVLILNRWAAVRFEWIALSFIAAATILALVIRISGQQFSAADIALTLSYSLNLTAIFQWAIRSGPFTFDLFPCHFHQHSRQSVAVETQMTAVERVLEYCALDQEPPAQLPPHFPRPPANWPAHGRIVFDNVCMSHSSQPHAPLALNHISLTIESASKVGVVGRTGAGKSSLIQTLFRMGTLIDGHILIDDIDIESVGLDDLRRRISIIPQDPVLFTGTMRSNLDQFGDYSDAEIWRALEQVSDLVA
jgi:ATP-binding cassette subfamily C (CFTR/MRP) protein 4